MAGRANAKFALCGFIKFSDGQARHDINDSIDVNDGSVALQLPREMTVLVSGVTSAI
jgi:hypothetical protein